MPYLYIELSSRGLRMRAALRREEVSAFPSSLLAFSSLRSFPFCLPHDTLMCRPAQVGLFPFSGQFGHIQYPELPLKCISLSFSPKSLHFPIYPYEFLQIRTKRYRQCKNQHISVIHGQYVRHSRHRLCLFG